MKTNPHKRDYTGTPIFAFKDKEGVTRFIPYAMETINEYIKAMQEQKEQNPNKSGAV